MPEETLKPSFLKKVKAKARVLRAKVKSAYTENPHTPQRDGDSTDNDDVHHHGNVSHRRLHHIVFPQRPAGATSAEGTQEKSYAGDTKKGKLSLIEGVPVEQSSHGAVPTNTGSTLEPKPHESDGPAGLDHQAVSTGYNHNDERNRAHLPTDGVSQGERGLSAPTDLKSESLTRTSDNLTLGPENPSAPRYSGDTASSKSGDRDAVISQGGSDSEESPPEQDSRTGSGKQFPETLNQSVKHENSGGLPQSRLSSSPGSTPQNSLQVEEYPTPEHTRATGIEKENLGDKDSDDVDVSNRNTPIAGDYETPATEESSETKPIHHRAYEGLAGAVAVAGGIAAATGRGLGLGRGDTSPADKHDSSPNLGTEETGQAVSQKAPVSVVGTETADAEKLPTEGSPTPSTDTSHTPPENLTWSQKAYNAILGGPQNTPAEEPASETGEKSRPTDGSEPLDESGKVGHHGDTSLDLPSSPATGTPAAGSQKPVTEKLSEAVVKLKDTATSKLGYADESVSSDSTPVSQKATDSAYKEKDNAASATDASAGGQEPITEKKLTDQANGLKDMVSGTSGKADQSDSTPSSQKPEDAAPADGQSKPITEQTTAVGVGAKTMPDHHGKPLIDSITESMHMSNLPDLWKSKWFGG